MKGALIGAAAAAVVVSGSAVATTSIGKTAAPHAAPLPPSRPAHADPARHPARPRPGSHRAPSRAAIGAMLAAWGAAHPGWKNPADMSHQELLQATMAHPEVYAPNLAPASRTMRIVEQYGGYTTLPAHVLALMRAQGYPIPADLPHVSLGSKLPGRRTR